MGIRRLSQAACRVNVTNEVMKQDQFRKKRIDTKIGTIEKKYGKDLGVRSDKKLGNYLIEKGYKSLSELLKNE